MAINLEGTALRVLTLEATNFETVTLDGVVFARKPTITTQPAGGTINDNQSHAMSVVADGLGIALTYQWFMDDGAISGATGASYTFTPAGDTTNRTFFCRVVGFGGGYTQTSTVTVTVNPSWTASNTLGRARGEFNGFAIWGFSSDYNPGQVGSFGSLTPNTITGAPNASSYWFNNTVNAFVQMAIIGSNNPASSRVTWQFGASAPVTTATYLNSTSRGSIYQVGIPSHETGVWTSTGSSPCLCYYYASLEAQEAHDYFDGVIDDSFDDYLIRWGVHISQRPDLYDN
ncbi:hypothetical protein FCV55_20980 [Vibrio sp. F13]|uniref:hypothetical protein n=1 Tax=Vibrio sp. F13 TaxID=2070777 RepID=UPI0010BD276D|nr:hypothetical protein [Vibrio sp. F13]TKF64253.1 hypothetical protein FCV55_20980 [Vibrio sp. F13]